MDHSKRLLEVAEVFEKTAAYIEALEGKQLQVERDAKMAEATKLAAQISTLVGEDISPETLEKLSELSPEVSNLMAQLSGGGTVDSLGGPELSKTASIHNNNPVAQNVVNAEARFISFLTTD